MQAVASNTEPKQSNWVAKLELGFERRQGRTVLAHRKRSGPLSVQRPFYPEGETSHVYILHPPGGVVGGDELTIKVQVDLAASALITTPGATKFYRSAGDTAQQHVQLKVNGELEWLPQENILFRGAKLRQQTKIDLGVNARLIATEINCFGRPSVAEQFDVGLANIGMRINREGKPIQIENTRITAQIGRNGPASMRGYPVSGGVYATPVTPAQLATLRQAVEPSVPGDYFALTLIDDLLVARFLGESTLRARQRMISLWQQLRPMLMLRSACAPRIWNT